MMLQSGWGLPRTKFVHKFPFLNAGYMVSGQESEGSSKIATCSLMKEANCNYQILTLIFRLGNQPVYGFICQCFETAVPPERPKRTPGSGEVGGFNLVERTGSQRRRDGKIPLGTTSVDGLPVGQTENAPWVWCCVFMGHQPLGAELGEVQSTSGERFLLLSPGKIRRVKTASA